MICPTCGNIEFKVIDSRPAEDNSIRRRRECEVCGKRFTTYERIEISPVMVKKKSGSREEFNRDKIARGVLKACSKNTVSAEQAESLASEIEAVLTDRAEKNCTSVEIGEMVLERLRALDDAAYIRFKSVYESFSDIGSFVNDLLDLRDEKK